IQRIDISPRVLDVITGDRAVWDTAVVGKRDAAIGRQNDVAPDVEVVVRADRPLCGGESSNRGIRSRRLIRQREGLERELVIRHGTQELVPDSRGGDIALNERGLR